MPHLKPLKWFLMYNIMNLWILLLLIKTNFLIKYYPKPFKKNNFMINMKWKI